MTQDQAWNLHYKQVMYFMRKNKRRPSKHRPEDHKMLNWIKYNKKLMAKGELDEQRVMRFNRMLALADKFRRLNQYSYSEPPTPVATQLELF